MKNFTTHYTLKKEKPMRTKARTFIVAAGVVGLLVGLAVAADHFDSPIANRDARKDITDIYAFRSPADQNNLVVVMNVSPHAPGYGPSPLFSNAANYNIHVDNTGDLASDATVAVTFSGTSPQMFSVAGLGTSPITGAVTAAGSPPNVVTSGAIKVFCGPRDDPFFFDLVAFKSFVAGPYVPANGLRAPGAGNPRDFFTGNNVGSIVLELPITALGVPSANTGTIKAWASITELQ